MPDRALSAGPGVAFSGVSPDPLIIGAAPPILLTADVPNTTITLADVTGLSVAVEAGKDYNFEFGIMYSAAATTTGARFVINGPATNFLSYLSTFTSATAAGIVSTVTNLYSAYNVPSAPATFSPYLVGNFWYMRGVMSPSASGVFVARFASEVAGSAITAKVGSYLSIMAIG